MEDAQIITMVDDKIKEYSDLYKRMDETKTRLEEHYELKDARNQKVEGAISVDLRTPRWQSNTRSNKLLKIEWQCVVESADKLPKTLIANVEKFSDAVWPQIDEYIADKYGITGGLDSWNAKKTTNRGIIGALWWVRFDAEGNLVTECNPLDMRWSPYQLNMWLCNRTWRSAGDLLSEYGKQKEVLVSAIPTSGVDIEVREFWDEEAGRLFVAGKKIKEIPNIFKKPTFVVVMTSEGFQFRDKGYLKNEAQTFDWIGPELYDEANRSASIAQTLGMHAIKPALVQPTKGGISKPVVKPPQPGETVRVDEGEEFQEVPHTDVNNAFVAATQAINQALSRNGVTDMEAGNTEAPNTALLVTTMNALLGEKLLASQDTAACFKMKSLRLLIEFVSKLLQDKGEKAEVSVGVRGMKYKIKGLGDPSTYRVRYEPHMNSKDQNIANTALAGAQMGIFPRRFILEKTMQVESPDQLIRELRMEAAEKVDPSIGMVEMALAYAKEALDLSDIDADEANTMSMSLTDSAVAQMKQRDVAMMPQPQQPASPATSAAQEPAKPNMQGMIALTGPGGR